MTDVIDTAEKQQGRISTAWVRYWLAQICAAIGHMHLRGVLHRDLSSSNIFLTSEGDVRVGDLGLSKKLGSWKTGGKVSHPTAIT